VRKLGRSQFVAFRVGRSQIAARSSQLRAQSKQLKARSSKHESSPLADCGAQLPSAIQSNGGTNGSVSRARQTQTQTQTQSQTRKQSRATDSPPQLALSARAYSGCARLAARGANLFNWHAWQVPLEPRRFGAPSNREAPAPKRRSTLPRVTGAYRTPGGRSAGAAAYRPRWAGFKALLAAAGGHIA